MRCQAVYQEDGYVRKNDTRYRSAILNGLHKWDPQSKSKIEHRAQHQEPYPTPIDSIEQFLERPSRFKLRKSQRINVAKAATVKIARRCMMKVVGPTPKIKRDERNET